jgi:NOL1/NOP2/sun family putative RNA methylase
MPIERLSMFPSAFVDRLRELGLDPSLYETYPAKAVYILRNEDEIVDKFDLKHVEWSEHCFWVENLKEIQEQHYNDIFVQDACSMVPVLALDVKKDDVVLDMCAAPGSKTLHLARKAHQVFAVDSHHKRIKRLEYNMRRFNIDSCVIIRADGRTLRLDTKVDKVLVDAPCSGEGMVGKIHKTMKLWSLHRIKRLSRIQRQLVLRGMSLLKAGGVLVYSSCTFAPEENESIVDYLVKKRLCKLEQISINHIQYTSGLTRWREKEYDPTLKKTIRIYPFHNNTNGFFVAKIRNLQEQG